jgi:hypothetical protein
MCLLFAKIDWHQGFIPIFSLMARIYLLQGIGGGATKPYP